VHQLGSVDGSAGTGGEISGEGGTPTGGGGSVAMNTMGQQEAGPDMTASDDGGSREAGPETTPIAAACTPGPGIQLQGQAEVPLAGDLRELVIDDCRGRVYVTNDTDNRVEVVDVGTQTALAPISVGSIPRGLDMTPDGARLYVANKGGTNISVVDLAAHNEVKKISFVPESSGETPLSLAISKNGLAFFSTTFDGSGYGAHVMRLDLATEKVVVEPSFSDGGPTTEATVLRANVDHSVIGAVAGDVSSAPVFVYTAAENKFKPEHDLQGFVNRAAVSPDGKMLVDGSYVLDADLNLLGTIKDASSPWAAFSATSDLAYRTSSNAVQILDTKRFVVTSSIALSASTTDTATQFNGIGNLAVSADGRWLAMITDHGLTLVPLK
jgi:YVTN family beta-propeller protein